MNSQEKDMTKELFLEIGTEEIPAAFLPKAIKDMDDMIRKALGDARITYGTVRTMATPRRLCLAVTQVSSRQADQVVEKMGPAKKAAFDAQGNPTRAAIGFAKGQGLEVNDLQTIATEKGEYLMARKTIAGVPTLELLPEILSRIVLGLPFRKSMRWSDLDIRFARPIHWIVALFGEEIVPFRIGNIETGRHSQGHRFMSPDAFEVADFADYLKKTRDGFVIVDPDERRDIIRREAEKAAAAVSGTPLFADELLETVTFLVEYPTAVMGSFDPEFLSLPREVLTTSMMSHQKYFPVQDATGRLLPHFITINNTLARDPSVVVRGNEKVIRARLSDARFFFEEDQKIPLDRRVEDLQKVVYHRLLGTSYEKVMRFRSLAAYLAGRIDPSLAETVDRAALLAKADLDTLMVGEFSELQGIMGREYAKRAGEDPVVAEAVYEHYLPVAAGGDLPATDIGAIVSLADKMDSITGFFAVGVVPTGTADPYALRRQALGIINIMLDRAYPLSLDEMIAQSLSILGEKRQRPLEEVQKDVVEFFRARFENLLLAQGRTYDVVDAVLATGISDLRRTARRIEAMEAFRNHPDYRPLAVAFKRAGNILKGFTGGKVDPDLFQAEVEKNLYNALQTIRAEAQALLAVEDEGAALTVMARMRQPVDAFFDGVLVMDKDEAIRENRLALLAEVFSLFFQVADFSKIVTETGSMG